MAMVTKMKYKNQLFLLVAVWLLKILFKPNFSVSPHPTRLQTWANDENRLQEIQWQLQQCQMVNEVLLIVFSTVGGPIQGVTCLSERLKRMTSVLLDGMHRPSVHCSKLT